jgi:hypothetical protein
MPFDAAVEDWPTLVECRTHDCKGSLFVEAGICLELALYRELAPLSEEINIH